MVDKVTNIVKIRNELIQAAKYKKQVEYIMLCYLIGLEGEDRELIDNYLQLANKITHLDYFTLGSVHSIILEVTNLLPSMAKKKDTFWRIPF